MESQDEDANNPHVRKVGEDDENGGQCMMEYELVEVTFGAYECVREESTEMLAELHEVVYPHGSRCLVKAVNVLEQIQTSAVTAHPRGHKAAGLQD